MNVHVLHIPKTGGTALIAALRSLEPDRSFVFHSHQVRLADIPAGDKVVFAIRDPIRRYVSGFNSRLRQGRPRYAIPWTPNQEEGFRRFPTPNSLAEALSDPDLGQRRAAIRLIKDMFHTGVPLSFWLSSADYLAARSDDILLILRQPQLTQDFERLKGLLALPPDLALPMADEAAHRTPPGFDTGLSEVAMRNLADWYAGDYPLFDAAEALRARQSQSVWRYSQAAHKMWRRRI